MRARSALLILACCALAGSAVRALPASPSGLGTVVLEADGATAFQTNIGDIHGRLVVASGCPTPVGVAVISGYLSGLDYEALDWNRGPSSKRFQVGPKTLPPEMARAAVVFGFVLYVASRAIGLPPPQPYYAIVGFAQPSCTPALERLLSRMSSRAALL